MQLGSTTGSQKCGSLRPNFYFKKFLEHAFCKENTRSSRLPYSSARRPRIGSSQFTPASSRFCRKREMDCKWACRMDLMTTCHLVILQRPSWDVIAESKGGKPKKLSRLRRGLSSSESTSGTNFPLLYRKLRRDGGIGPCRAKP